MRSPTGGSSTGDLSATVVSHHQPGTVIYGKTGTRVALCGTAWQPDYRKWHSYGTHHIHTSEKAPGKFKKIR